MNFHILLKKVTVNVKKYKVFDITYNTDMVYKMIKI